MLSQVTVLIHLGIFEVPIATSQTGTLTVSDTDRIDKEHLCWLWTEVIRVCILITLVIDMLARLGPFNHNL